MHRTRAAAFTLIELLVVVTVIVVLLALLAPALDRAIEMTIRTVCATNEKVIATGAAQYGLQNRKVLFISRGRDVTLAFDPLGSNAHESGATGPYAQDALVDWPAAMATVGLTSADKQLSPPDPYFTTSSPTPYMNNQPGKMWNCPGRSPWVSYWGYNPVFAANGAPDMHTMFVGYMYYGGLVKWKSANLRSPNPNVNPPTPKRITDPGDRTLVADNISLVNEQWGSPEFQNGGTPAHRDGPGNFPAGSNHAFLDGSVAWVEADRLMMLHTWNNNLTQLYFFWQRDVPDWKTGDPTTDRFYLASYRNK
jgi:type II secretory pathway pseudopilin PulG